MESSSAQWRRRLLLLRGALVAVITLLAAGASMRQIALPHLLWPMTALLWAPSLLYWFSRSPGDRQQRNWLAAELLYDSLVCMLLTYLYGGSANPLAFYLLVPLLVTALTQSVFRTVALCLLQIAAYGLLLYWHQVPANHSSLHAMTHEMPVLHGQGMWLAFSLLAIALAVLGQANQRAQQQHRAQQATELTLALQRERMYQLASSLADRAHELNTPLSALFLQLDGLREQFADTPLLSEELSQMQALLDRMHQVLRQPSEQDVEGQHSIRPSELAGQLQHALKLLAPSLHVDWQGLDDRPLSPAFAWQRVFLNLGYNACDAGATCLRIETATRSGERILMLSDDGPAHTEKARQGMGIGKALIETTLASLGGSFELRHSQNWTQALITLHEYSDEHATTDR